MRLPCFLMDTFEIKRLKPVFLIFVIHTGLALYPVETSYAEEAKKLKPRVEANVRAGTERSILMTEAWLPLAQDQDRVLYGDLRLMGDDDNNREWNFGLGYRALTQDSDAIMGVHGWLDRRRSERGSIFYQVTGGYEYFSDSLDVRLNAYIPFNQEERYVIPGGSTTPYLADTGIFYDSNGLLVEKPMHGVDLEFSIPINALKGDMDSFRVSAGGFAFKGRNVEGLQGGRLRVTADINSDVQIGARLESDNQRGTQGFLEATLRFPFGAKASARTLGLKSRLDESPERDIDIITSARTAVEPEKMLPVLNVTDGNAQRVFHVDNSRAVNGDGSVNNPYNNLTDANAAANSTGDVIYINYGTGTSLRMDQGVSLSLAQQSLIGEGSAFVYDGGRFTTATGQNFSGTVLKAAGSAPVMTNITGDGITVTGADACISGVQVDAAQGNGIFAQATGGQDLGTLMIQNITVRNSLADGLRVESSGAGSTVDVKIESLRTSGNNNGVRLYASSDAALSGMMTTSVATGNAQHGVILYDDSTAGDVNVDLGGGARSLGRNSFYGNGLEELAVDIDGGTLMARNNWWGQSSGLYQDNPAAGLKPQIYFGAPLYDGLVGHWTLDREWTSNTTAYDRSGNGYNGTLTGGLDLTDLVAGQHRDGLNLNGTSDYIRITGIAETFSQYSVLSWAAPDKTNSGNADQNLYGFTVLSDGRPLVGTGPYPLWVTVKNSDVLARTFNTSNAGVASSGAGITSTEWTAIDVTSVRGGGSVIYIDGAPNRSFTNPGNSSVWNSGELYIGELRAGRGIWFDGVVDDVRLYNRVLTAAEMAELYRMDTSNTINSSAGLLSDPN